MSSENTECIIPTGISERKEQYGRGYTNSKKKRNRENRTMKNIPSNDKPGQSEETRISSVHEDLRSQEAGQWQMEILRKENHRKGTRKARTYHEIS